MRSMIICVDDDKWLLTVLSDLLNEWMGENYQIEKASSGQEALTIIDECLAANGEISLVISDYIMPGMKGDALLEQVKQRTPATRRIMLTGFAAIEGIANAINKAGIYRFMSKPWDNKDMMLTVVQAVRSYEQEKHAEKLANSNKDLYHKFQNMAMNLQISLKQLTDALLLAVETRDGLAGHSRRVADYGMTLAREMKVPEADVKNLELASLLHDIGKLGLSDQELSEVKDEHCYEHTQSALRQAELAKFMLAGMDAKIQASVIYHMERVDGQGPYKLPISAVPLEARIIGLCSYFDLLLAARPDTPPNEVLRLMLPYKNTVFDGLLFDMLAKTL